MSVQTASPKTQNATWTKQDRYPTRLRQPQEALWQPRQEEVVKGRHLDGPLSGEQLDRFERDGFLFEPNFLGQAELEALRAELAVMLDRDDFRDRDFSITEPQSHEIRSLFAIHHLSSRYSELAQDERLMGRARQIVGGD